jgi:tryptophan-rich sensory protein
MRPLVLVLLTVAAAVLGGLASRDAPMFYGQLQTPPWAPPAWVFGPVWTLLYAMMAGAAVLVARTRPGSARSTALFWYAAQLGANALWSWLFFYYRSGALATADVLVLWILVAVTTLQFWTLRPLAGALLVPYFGWVSFAAALTIVIWRLNPAAL